MSVNLDQNRSYRRGAIMGLTLAEAFILIAFALLLLFAFWQWETEKESENDIPEVRALPSDQREALATALRDGSLNVLLDLAKSGMELDPATIERAASPDWRLVESPDEQALLDAVSSLPTETVQEFVRSAQQGVQPEVLKQLSDLAEKGVNLDPSQFSKLSDDRWRFIDRNDLRRLLDASVALPADAQRNLADMVEAGDIAKTLREFGALEELKNIAEQFGEISETVELLQAIRDTGMTPSEIVEQAKKYEVFNSADETLDIISRRIKAAEQRERQLVAALRNELGTIVESVGGVISDDGAIVLPETVLFEQGSANVRPQLRDFLSNTCDPWLQVLRDSGVPIAEVKIEGHASSEWRTGTSAEFAYLQNLDLSQRRSQAVLRACLELVNDAALRQWAREHLVAVGYSSARPIRKNGAEDRDASRRVVFSVSPDRNSLIEEIGSDAATIAALSNFNPADLYDATKFGPWEDDDRDCQNTRQEMLLSQAIGTQLELSPDNCTVLRGSWNDPYSGKKFNDPSLLDVDHIVPLAWAWDHGANTWTNDRRLKFKNDTSAVLVVDLSENRSKGKRPPTEWLPSNEGFHCQYVIRFQRVVKKYELAMEASEVAALANLRNEVCGQN